MANYEVKDQQKGEEKDIIERCLATNVAKKIKLWVGIFCFLLFIVQSWQTTYQYFEYNTVINTHLFKPEVLTMPAVTVCAPVLIPFRILCFSNETDDQCSVRLDETAELIVTATSKQQRLSLVRAFHGNRYVTKGPAKTHLNIDEVLTVFDCRLAKVLFRANYTSQMAFCANETQIVKSFIYNIKESKVGEFCSTYFSEFDPKYDKSKYQIFLPEFGNTVMKFVVELQNTKLFAPGQIAWGVNIAVHPPNMIPSDIEWKFMRIKSNKSYVIEYSRTESNLLPPPYKTMCRDYDNDKSGAKSQSDCIRLCVDRAAVNKIDNCRRQWNVIQLNTLSDTERLCIRDSVKDVEYFSIRRNCKRNCAPDCHQEDYDVRMEIVDDNYVTKYAANITNASLIDVKHQTRSDVIITHNPEMTISTYVGTVGGLGGIYLGISVIACYEYLVLCIRYLQKLWKSKFSKSEAKIEE